MPGPEELLARYVDLVAEWAPRLDLVSPGDLSRFRERHVDDSLKALPWIDSAPPGPAVDVGSGAGCPGIPLSIARPGRTWRLLEPRHRRAAFLEEVVRELDLSCEILALTAAQAASDPALGGAHSLATARALAPPPEAQKRLEPLLVPGGRGIVWSGRDVPRTQEGLLIFDV